MLVAPASVQEHRFINKAAGYGLQTLHECLETVPGLLGPARAQHEPAAHFAASGGAVGRPVYALLRVHR